MTQNPQLFEWSIHYHTSLNSTRNVMADDMRVETAICTDATLPTISCDISSSVLYLI